MARPRSGRAPVPQVRPDRDTGERDGSWDRHRDQEWDRDSDRDWEWDRDQDQDRDGDRDRQGNRDGERERSRRMTREQPVRAGPDKAQARAVPLRAPGTGKGESPPPQSAAGTEQV